MKPIEYEIVWTEASDDTRPLEAGFIVYTRVIEVELIRRQNLTAALVAAGNLLRMHPTAHGFFVRRKRT